MATIRTARLELAPLSAAMVDALVSGDVPAAERHIGARVSRWLTVEWAHFVQLHLARLAADVAGQESLGWAIVLLSPGAARMVIGSIGFHGPPDERGRLEVGYALDPECVRRGYAAEAVTALLRWATTRYGVTRFLVSVVSGREEPAEVPVEIWDIENGSPGGRIDVH